MTPSDKHRKRMSVFIDGRNVHYGLRDLRWPEQWDVGALAAALSAHYDLQIVHYYNALPLQRHLPGAAYGQQLRYYEYIDETPRVVFRRGYLSDIGGKPVEKLVDVMLALDLALGAHRDEYDVAALVSADGEFAPAVDEARAAGKEVINFVFRHKQSFRLAKCCTEVRYLKRKHFAEVVV